MPEPLKKFSGIFISYRREDTAGHAGRVFDRLSSHFGDDSVFMDIDHLQPGEDFVQVIEDAVGSCGVLIAIIGRQWLSSPGNDSRRLDNPLDFVRLEISAALNRNIRVIPILVQGASMPNPQDLPEDLSRLTRRHALELSDLRWRHDIDRLTGAIEKALVEHQEVVRKEEEQAAQRKTAQQENERRRREAEAQRIREEETKRKAAQQKDESQRREAEAQRILDVAAAPRDPVVSTRTGTGTLPSPPPQPTSNRKFLIIGSALVLFVIAVALVWLIWSSTQQDKPARATLHEPDIAKAEMNNKVKPPDHMVYVPGGEFLMGRDQKDGGDEYEWPAHAKIVRPFFIDVYEVTREEYKKCVDTGNCTRPQGWTNGRYPEGTGRQPVTGVDWYAASAYAKWAKKRLPTEEEWEFAARGTDGRLYPWGGNQWRKGLANADNVSKQMWNVEECKDKSPYDAFGMIGNAWEWTNSNLEAYPGGKLPSGLKLTGEEKVIRGGRYLTPAKEATTTFRGFVQVQGDRYDETGFRCVLDINP
jgi:formylglycine-generating enzyme required for sulfatase activity